MSSIAFGSGQGYVEIGGRERARMGGIVDGLAWAMHDRGGARINRSPQEAEAERLRYTVNMFGEDTFAERLAWVSLIGNDRLRLLAHIHGQCEIHGWVHPDDGEWFADLVEGAVGDGLLGDDSRNYYGTWQQVADLARSSTTPLVSSYSVCESWPDPYLIAKDTPHLFTPTDAADPWESWADLPEAERQRIADEAIPACAPRWHPAEWGIWANDVRGRNPWAEVASR